MYYQSVLLLSLLINSLQIIAAEYEVGQQNKEFTESMLKIKVGDSVRFTNQDPFFHNVYSISETKYFDLGSYAKGEFKTVTFDKPGTAVVECAIHPKMRMTIQIQ